MASPRYSIVIPTRNRPDLLRSALTTAVAQRFADLEIVVSDNGDSPDARPVADELDDGRVRYVRPDRSMTQPDHFEFGVGHARGEWIVVYADDDGAPSSFIDRLDAAITNDGPRLVGWPPCVYLHEYGQRSNRLIVQPFTGSLERLRSRDLLGRMFALREEPNFPGLGRNVAVRRDLFDDVRSRTGRLLHPPFLDWTFGTLSFGVEPHYVYVDQPLTVWGSATSSVSRALVSGTDDGHRYLQQLGADGQTRCVPLRTQTISNLVAESIMRAKSLAPELFEGLELDRRGYFLACYRDLERLDADAAVGPAAAWRAAVREADPLTRLGVLRGVATIRARRRARVLRAAWADRVPPVAAIWRAARRLAGRDAAAEQPLRSSFADLAEAARHLEEAVLAGVPFPVATETSPAAVGVEVGA